MAPVAQVPAAQLSALHARWSEKGAKEFIPGNQWGDSAGPVTPFFNASQHVYSHQPSDLWPGFAAGWSPVTSALAHGAAFPQSANEFGCVGQHAMDFVPCARAPPVDPSKTIAVFWNTTPVLGPKAVVSALANLGLPALRIRLCTDAFEGAIVVYFATEWQASVFVSKLAGSHRRLMDSIGKNASVAMWSSEDVPTLLRLALKDLPRVPDQEPEIDPDDDDYDPRKPEYVMATSQEDAEADSSCLMQQQIAKLESALTSRKSTLEPKVREHYEHVLKEMRRSIDKDHAVLVRADSDPGLRGTDSPVVQFGHARAWSDPSLNSLEMSEVVTESGSVSDVETSAGTDGVNEDTDLWTNSPSSASKESAEHSKGLAFEEDTGLETDSLDLDLRHGEDTEHYTHPLLQAHPCPTEAVEGSVGQGD